MLIPRFCCPGLVRYAPSPQVGFSGLSGQVTKWHGFWIRWHFHALSAIRIRPLPCFYVRAFPKCLLAAYALEHTICRMGKKINQPSTLSSTAHVWCTHVHWAAMFGHRTSDFTSGSLNMLQASQTVCKRSAANVPIFMGKHVILAFFQTLFTTSKSHVGTCFLEFWAIFALLIIHILWVVLKFMMFVVHHNRPCSYFDRTRAVSDKHANFSRTTSIPTLCVAQLLIIVISLHVHTRSETLHGVFGSHC